MVVISARLGGQHNKLQNEIATLKRVKANILLLFAPVVVDNQSTE
jgi:hypothetical protein